MLNKITLNAPKLSVKKLQGEKLKKLNNINNNQSLSFNYKELESLKIKESGLLYESFNDKTEYNINYNNDSDNYNNNTLTNYTTNSEDNNESDNDFDLCPIISNNELKIFINEPCVIQFINHKSNYWRDKIEINYEKNFLNSKLIKN